MTIILQDADLDLVPTMAIALAAIQEAFEARTRGELIAPPRHHVSFPGRGDLVFTIGGTLGAAPLAGFRVYDTFSGPRHSQIIAVWSADTAELDGIVVGSLLGEIRTGAIGGIAIAHLSAPDARTVGLVGTGRQARTQLLAAAAVRTLAAVRVYGRDSERCRAFCSEMAALIKVPVHPASTSREAVQDADIVLCATNSVTPVIDARWLKPGAHVNTVGPKTRDQHELGLDIAERAALIATDSPEQTRAYDMPFFLSGSPSGARLLDLASIVSGAVPGRSSTTDCTLFCSVGLAGTEVLVAARVIAQHREGL